MEANILCGKCKEPFAGGKFCIVCGASAAEATEESRLAIHGTQPVRDKIASTTSDATELFHKIRASDRLNRQRALDWARRNRPLSISVAVLATLAVGYTVTQAGIILANGPDSKILEYAAAVESGDFAALDDHSLFPNGDSALVPPEVIAAWSIDATDGKIIGRQTSRSWLEAEATVSRSVSDSISISLTADTVWNWGLQFPVWRVSSDGPLAHFTIDDGLADAQRYSFGGVSSASIVTTGVAALRALPNRPIAVLPGNYTSTLLPYGFVGEAALTTPIWEAGEVHQIPLTVPSLEMSAKALKVLQKQADSTTARCIRNRCSALGSNKETDFDLWSQYPYTTYTSSNFSVSFKNQGCVMSGETLDSPTQITATFNCPVTARAHLYVEWIYYYGYFDDYYYYYDLYDSAVRTVTPTITITINPDTEKISVKKSSL